jgi:uncharacterized protein
LDNEPRSVAQPNGSEVARSISVQIDDDRMTAFVSVRAGPVAGEPELRSALAASGVDAGFDVEAFARLARRLNDPAFEITRELIARGSAARPGEAGRFESPFLDGLRPGHLREDGTLDFHDRELLKPVQRGDEIGRVWPARAGAAGRLVDGSAISPAPVKEAEVTLGSGVKRDEGGVIRATRSGVVICKTPQSIDVVDRHVHEGAVDLRSGHLHMLGSLMVKGDVLSTFGVYATGDVEIRGSVDNGTVYAGGNVRIHRGVRGSAATVCAEGNISVHHVESASLYAGRLLRVDQALHAKLCAGCVEVSGKLRGGVTSAESSAVVQEAGAPHATGTEIAVGEPLELPVQAAKRELERAKLRRGKRPAASASERGKGGKLGRVQAVLQGTETERLAERAHRRQELCAVAFVEVRVAHAGVTIRIGDQQLVLEGQTPASRFSIDNQTGQLQAVRIKP